MIFGGHRGMRIDQFAELMDRHAALSQEVQRRIEQHMQAVRKQLPLSSGSRGSVGGSSEGITLGPDGTLMATVVLHDLHGVETRLVLRAGPGGPVEVVEPGGQSSTSVPAGQSRDESEDRLREVTALSHQHLPGPAAKEFLTLLRPALRLVRAGEGDRVIAQLGGLPTLPINEWPTWEGHGPLSHVLSLDCAPVAEFLPELGLPPAGRLGFFYFDGVFDNFESTVGTWDASTRPGFRVLHLHPEQSTRVNITDAATPTPPGLKAFPAVALTAVRTVTWPSHETPMAEAVWQMHELAGERDGLPAESVLALYDALWKLPGAGPDAHQIGGHASPQQGPVEMEVEQLRRGLDGKPFEWGDPDVQASAAEWQLLLQVASDDGAGMMWGDVGQLYFLASDMGKPDEALFTWQCG